jgi:N-acetylglucosaminyldiphosphoundecaprenol N-acetyl-beta-D-mannosaminyltransferase
MHKRKLLGLEIYDTRLPEFVSYLENIIEARKKKTIFGVSAAAFARLKFRPDLYGIYKKFDILIAEGAGIPYLSRLFRVKVSEKIGLVNLTFSLLELANKRNYKVLLFGSSEEINNSASLKIREKYPNVILCKGIDGFFKENDLDSIVETINKEQPQIVFIGISYPIKERFAIKYRNHLNTNLIVPCGGAFEVIAGKVKSPVGKFKKFPVAWLFRLVQEPRRMFKDIFVTVVYSVFWVIPILYIKHILRIERNPDIGKFFGLTGNEWNAENGSVKP